MADQRKTGKQARNRQHHGAQHISRRQSQFAPLIEQRRIEREGGKRGVAAENAGHHEQPPGLRGLTLEGEIAGDQPHHGRSRDVDDEGAPGKSGAYAAGADEVDEMAQARAKAAPEENPQIAHRTFPASAKSPGTEVLPHARDTCKDRPPDTNEKGGSFALPPPSIGSLKDRTLENSWSTYSQFTR